MSSEWRMRSSSLAWSNPLAWWWSFLTLVSGANIAVWFCCRGCTSADRLCSTSGIQFMVLQIGSLGSPSGIELMLLLCAAYVFGCAFRSMLPRADVQRICLFDTWLSSVAVGRSVATVAEICFAAQWAIILHQLGTMTGSDTTLNAAWVIVPLIIVAECFSWYAVLTTNYLGNAIENSIWAVVFFLIGVGLCRLLPEFNGPVRAVLGVTIVGIAGYLAFLITVDVPMYLNRWRAVVADGSKLLRPLEGLRDVSTRWIVITTSPNGRKRSPGCRSISVRRSGPASRCASATRSRVSCRAIAPSLRSQAGRRTCRRPLAIRIRREILLKEDIFKRRLAGRTRAR